MKGTLNSFAAVMTLLVVEAVNICDYYYQQKVFMLIASCILFVAFSVMAWLFFHLLAEKIERAESTDRTNEKTIDQQD